MIQNYLQDTTGRDTRPESIRVRGVWGVWGGWGRVGKKMRSVSTI